MISHHRFCIGIFEALRAGGAKIWRPSDGIESILNTRRALFKDAFLAVLILHEYTIVHS